MSIASSLEDATVVAYVAGGTSPYNVTVTYGPKQLTKTLTTTTGLVRFSFDKQTDNIIPLTVSATDSKNIQGSATMDLNADELKKAGWVLPADTSTGPTSPATPGATQVQPTAPISDTLTPTSAQ